jgi:hypothetical protein
VTPQERQITSCRAGGGQHARPSHKHCKACAKHAQARSTFENGRYIQDPTCIPLLFSTHLLFTETFNYYILCLYLIYLCSFSTFILLSSRHTNGSATKCPTAQRIKIQLINPPTLFSQLSSIFPDSIEYFFKCFL